MSGCRQYRLEGVVHTTGLAGGFDFKKFYNKQVNRYSQKNCTTFFIRHGIIVLLRNATEACPVGELAKAIDDKILKALADAEKRAEKETKLAPSIGDYSFG